MKRNDILSALIARGYRAEAKQTIRNGVIYEGIVIRSDEQIAPVIYTQGLIDEAEKRGTSLAEVVSQVIRIYEENKDVDICIEELFNKEYVLSHVFIGLQKTSEQDLIKEESGYEGIEKYLYLRGDAGYIVKLNSSLLENVGISKEEAWESAGVNTFSQTKIRTMGEILSELTGRGFDDEEENPANMFAVTNTFGLFGASAILDTVNIAEYFGKLDISRLVVLPSSIHEMLLIPADVAPGMDELNAMVKEINEAQVAPEDRLTDRAYVMNL